MILRLCLLLLLAMNLGVGLWWALRAPPAQDTPPAATEPDVPPLVLLGELRAPEPTVELAEPPEPVGAAPTAGEVCLGIGPFLTQADLRAAVGALTPRVSRIQFREDIARVERGHWVFLPAPGSREQALQLARDLSGKGLRDFYVVTAGERENMISLGLFRDPENARKRLADVRAAGFDAQSEVRVDDLPQFWIDIAAEAGFDWRAPLGGYAAVEARAIPCAPQGAPAAAR